MGNLSLKVKLDELGFELQEVTDEIARDLVSAVHNLAASTYQKAVELAGSKLHTTRQQYINALHMEQEGEGVWVVYLDAEANDLEDGYDSFNMLPKLASGPKSKVAKDGHRYVVVPMRQRTVPANPNSQKQADLASRLVALSKIRKWDKVKAGVSGATGKYTTIERMKNSKDDHPYLKGLTRVREYKSPGAKEPMSSAYFTFRTASTKQDASNHWVHPGFAGAKIFPEVEKWAEFQLEMIINEFLL